MKLTKNADPMALNLMQVHSFHYLMTNGVKILLQRLTYNMNDNPKINFLKLKNIRQERLKILGYFSINVGHHYKSKLIQ